MSIDDVALMMEFRVPSSRSNVSEGTESREGWCEVDPVEDNAKRADYLTSLASAAYPACFGSLVLQWRLGRAFLGLGVDQED